MPGLFRYLYSTYRWVWLAALAPALILFFNFTPLDGKPMSHTAWLLYYPAHMLLRYWPHEMGHVLAGWVSGNRLFITFWGTGLEAGLPLFLLCWCIHRRETVLSWLPMLWLGYVLLDVSYYMADAAAPKLLYVVPFDTRTYTAAEIGNIHDWVVMLKALGQLQNAVSLASYVYLLAVWLLWLPPTTLCFFSCFNKHRNETPA